MNVALQNICHGCSNREVSHNFIYGKRVEVGKIFHHPQVRVDVIVKKELGSSRPNMAAVFYIRFDIILVIVDHRKSQRTALSGTKK